MEEIVKELREEGLPIATVLAGKVTNDVNPTEFAAQMVSVVAELERKIKALTSQINATQN